MLAIERILENYPPRGALSMALISLFKQQLESESQVIAANRELVKRGDYLIWWYFLRRIGLVAQEVEGIVCD